MYNCVSSPMTAYLEVLFDIETNTFLQLRISPLPRQRAYNTHFNPQHVASFLYLMAYVAAILD
jgi:hypothetical protein